MSDPTQRSPRGIGNGMSTHGGRLQHGKPHSAEARDLQPNARKAFDRGMMRTQALSLQYLPVFTRGTGTMNATIIARTPTSFTLQVEVPYNGSMLDFEETLQERLNDAGVVATTEGLQQFDTDGSPITVGPVKLTTKGQVEKDYQAPYGVATLARHVYQSPEGGPTYCPLDRDARIVVTSTPRFAKTLSHKYAEFSSPRAQIDLEENHGRAVSRCLIQDVADAVAAAAMAKEEDWSYALPRFEEPPSTVAVSLDGTCLLMGEGGWRETMVGTLSFYDQEGERQHTIYLAATPEYGKAKF